MSYLTTPFQRTWVGVLLSVVAVALLASCGSGEDSGSANSSESAKSTERAFLTGMAHHHESAIEMATIAQERGQSSFVKSLGKDIASTQKKEIGQMEPIYSRRIGGTLKPDSSAHDGLGLSAKEAGMDHDEAMNAMLEKASPFDKAFIDEMVPHHRGAVRMAQVVLKKTDDADLEELATGIISTQQREIVAMNRFRTRQYGAPVPEAAVKDMGSEPDEDGKMEHSSH